MIVPSRSLTAMDILAFDPSGRRMSARVWFAVATALEMIPVTCAAVRPPTGPVAAGTRYPSGASPGLATGPSVNRLALNVPGVTPAGAVV